MTRKPSIHAYRIIFPRELTDEDRAILRRVSRERVFESLTRLLGDGSATLSQVQRQYGAIMAEVGHA